MEVGFYFNSMVGPVRGRLERWLDVRSEASRRDKAGVV